MAPRRGILRATPYAPASPPFPRRYRVIHATVAKARGGHSLTGPPGGTVFEFLQFVFTFSSWAVALFALIAAIVLWQCRYLD